MKMKQFSLLGLLVLVTVIEAIPHKNDALKFEWDAWKTLHGRSYASKEEESKGLRAYLNNSNFITNHNVEAYSGKHTYFLKMNQFGDMLHNEFLAKYVDQSQSIEEVRKDSNISSIFMSPPQHQNLPKEIDWRSKGAVTHVRNQGEYKSSNYIAATGVVEGTVFLKTGKLIPLSEQQLIDCDDVVFPRPSQQDFIIAILGIQYMGGIESEETYPFHPKESKRKCHFNKSKIAVGVGGLIESKYSEIFLDDYIAKSGPKANRMNAAPRSFQFYSHGVYSDTKCKNDSLNHGALIVGYGITKDQEKYWTVKNSWGTSWGEDGYIRIAKDKGNMCGVGSMTGWAPDVYLRK